MIQELLGGSAAGGGGGIGGEREDSITIPSPAPAPSPSHSSSSSTTTTPGTSSASENQNLRCPRCDSSNTKFCYYNNYNLTQPRHFCKTCRRYWTKGGALRNVPIGGGCRRNKNVCVSTLVGNASAEKLKTGFPEIGKLGRVQELQSNPILWASPHNSHLLAFLRANPNSNSNPSPNPNLNINPSPISNSLFVKEESVMIGSHINSETPVAAVGLSNRAFGLEPFNQFPSTGLGSSPFWRNNLHQAQQQQQNHHQQQQSGFVVGGEVQNTGIQELYQRVRSSDNRYPDDHSPLLLGNGVSSPSSSSTILEPASVAAAELGYWNPALSWSDLPSTNGAYP